MADIISIPAHRLAALIRLGELSPVEVVEAFLDRACAWSPKLNAFSDLYVDEARAAARDAHRALAAGVSVGPLHGVPIALKDAFDVAGKPTTAGSAHFRQRIAPRSARIVERLRECGAIVIGKTRMVEFGLGAAGLNEQFGTPWNPCRMDAHYAPGGSSSGAAVAVAARLVPWALGTDTGGSARIPAAWCGVAGMKPTQSHIGMTGVAPLSPTLDVIGPIGRSAEDLACLFGALTGRPDESALEATSTQTFDRVNRTTDAPWRRTLQGRRIGVLPAAELGGVDSEILGAYHSTLDAFASSGAALVPVALPRPLQEYRVRTSAITFHEAYALYGELAHDPATQLDPAVRQRLLRASGYASADYAATLAARGDFQQEFAALFAQVDALLTPSTQNLPPLVAVAANVDPPNAFTRFVNFLDLCAVSVPNGVTKAGFPTGLQIVCNSYSDATALDIAIAYQRGTGWHMQVPPL
ncbi:Glutamyl-tRNA(Gln) amidotransferase subunit A (plasmid) [Burkholderia sp. AD24]|nr:Glutamyl-tRNA(Gln) amidotransferase subunit A [Burkholderia sp. AD24]